MADREAHVTNSCGKAAASEYVSAYKACVHHWCMRALHLSLS